MRIYLLIIPTLIALFALVMNGYFSFYYIEALLGRYSGAGGAQWQMAFAYWHWPVACSAVALVLAALIYKKLIKLYLAIFSLLSLLPIILFVLVKYGIY